MALTCGALFAGHGGFEMGVAAALGDVHVSWVSEIDKAATRVLTARVSAPNLGDITTVNWSTVEPVDVLTAGFPCQDVSVAGKRAGLTLGTRTGLWSEVVRAIVGVRPKLVVLENVLGLMYGRWTNEGLLTVPWVV